MHHTIRVAMVLASGLALSACTTTKPVTKNPAQSFVDTEMSGTLTSIDQSLRTLLILERGGESLRKEGPIGTTVAGAKGPDRPAIQVPVPKPATDPSILEKRARIQWTGSAVQLLSQLAGGIGYDFKEIGSGPLPVVKLPNQELSLRDLLSRTATQIDGKADIRVDTVNKKIQLIHR